MNKKALITIWLFELIGGIGLYYWHVYGSWRKKPGLMIDRDIVRFNEISLLFTAVWLVTFFVVFYVSIAYYIKSRK